MQLSDVDGFSLKVAGPFKSPAFSAHFAAISKTAGLVSSGLSQAYENSLKEGDKDDDGSFRMEEDLVIQPPVIGDRDNLCVLSISSGSQYAEYFFIC